MDKSGQKQSQPHLVAKDSGAVHAIPEGITRVGRAPGNDVVLPDTSISRFQCYLVRKGSVVRVFDADDSRNKTRLGRRTAHGQTLKNGHVLKLGRSRLKFTTRGNVEEKAALPDVDQTSNGGRRPGAESGEKPRPAAIAAVTDAPPDSPEPATDQDEAPETPVAASSTPAVSPETLKRYRSGKSRGAPDLMTLILLVVILLVCTVGVGVFIGLQFSKSGAETESGSVATTGGNGDDIYEAVRNLNSRVEDLRSQLDTERVRVQMVPMRIQNELDIFEQTHDGVQTSRLERIHKKIARIENFIQLPEDESEKKAAEAHAERRLTDMEKAIAALEDEEDAEPAASDFKRGLAEKKSAVAAVSRETLVPSDARRSEIGEREINTLVNHLADVIDNYASPEATPDTLNPELERLVLGIGRSAARGVVKVESHARTQLGIVDKNIKHLKKRIAKLLNEARRKAKTPKKSNSYEKEDYAYGKNNPLLERAQRFLELSEKKLEILEVQRARLEALHDAILQSLIHLGDRSATLYLTQRFNDVDDLTFRLMILRVLAAHRTVHSIPKLLPKLRHADETLRDAVRRTLSRIVGSDLGAQPGVWMEWYHANSESNS